MRQGHRDGDRRGGRRREAGDTNEAALAQRCYSKGTSERKEWPSAFSGKDSNDGTVPRLGVEQSGKEGSEGDGVKERGCSTKRIGRYRCL